ncbi:hypothetical protein QR680_006173 [Steinernema hermaphroditum]|uniref:Uncharacterized protein n=1 Tax=Steinernema hermaphroditum TaxID=289476 RepID=A0AA39LWY7_9BILA|nr:hypothetical protein QR680_006173 [Steinernema hermaphroditum]
MLKSAKVTSAVTHLKSRYYKYLENFCSANGIELSSLKNEGHEHENLEMFFGGLPVLIGLKYFYRLRTLRLIGQDVTNLRPLSDVADSLEELWVCEGILVDLTGIERCHRLQHVYLYDNSISSGAPIEALVDLKELWIQNNCLADISFLQALSNLNVLKISGDQLSDTGPQTFNFHCSCCKHSTHRALRENHFRKLSLRGNTEDYYTWIGCHFSFLEYLDDDRLEDKFTPFYLDKADNKLLSLLSESLNREDLHVAKLKEIKENGDAIQKRLSFLSSALKRAKEILPVKEGRRDIAQRFFDHTATSIEIWGTVKKNARNFEKWTYELDSYFANVSKLESGAVEVFRFATHFEEKTIVDHFKRYFVKNSSFEFRLKWARILGSSPLNKGDVDNLCFVVPTQKNCLREIKRILHSRWHIAEHYEFTKDVSTVIRSEEFSSELLLVPISKCTSCNSHPLMPQMEADDVILDESIASSPRSPSRSDWKEREVLGVLIVEIATQMTISIDDFLNIEHFTKRLDLETKKLRDMQIDLKMDQNHLEEPIEERTRERKKSIALERTLNELVDFSRFTTHEPFRSTKLLTLRNTMDLTLMFRPSVNVDLHASSRALLTCLDLSDLSLLRLDDSIDDLRRLQCLSLSRNKMVLLRSLKALKYLRYLDISHNKLTSIESLPDSLEEVNFSNNNLSHIQFLRGLPKIRIVNGAHNNIQSIRSLDQSPEVERLLLASNQLKDKFELDYLQVMTKLTYLDMTSNPISKTSTYSKIVTAHCPLLKMLDRNATADRERSSTSTIRKIGRALTIEFVEQMKPDFEKHSHLDLSDENLQMVAIDKDGISRLNAITSLDLSKNSLQHLHDLTELNGLHSLNLSSNQMINITTGPSTVLTHLTVLSLSNNGITNSSLGKLGIEYLPVLKRLDLSRNLLIKFDSFNLDSASLEDVDVSNNQIRSIRRKTLENLKRLNLSDNKLKDLNGLSLPAIEELDVSNNKITTCGGLKQLSGMPILLNFCCTGNPVKERRVYVDYIKNQAKNLQFLDGLNASEWKVALEKVKPAPSLKISMGNASEFSMRCPTPSKENSRIPILVTSESSTSYSSRKGLCLIGTQAVRHNKK